MGDGNRFSQNTHTQNAKTTLALAELKHDKDQSNW